KSAADSLRTNPLGRCDRAELLNEVDVCGSGCVTGPARTRIKSVSGQPTLLFKKERRLSSRGESFLHTHLGFLRLRSYSSLARLAAMLRKFCAAFMARMFALFLMPLSRAIVNGVLKPAVRKAGTA